MITVVKKHGGLYIVGTLAVTGILNYKETGNKVLVTEDVLKDSSWLNSILGVNVTINHPDAMTMDPEDEYSAERLRSRTIGSVTKSWWDNNDKSVKVEIRILNRKFLRDAVQSGAIYLSPGYNDDIKTFEMMSNEEKKKADGKYNAIQIKRHTCINVALTERPRGGKQCKLDSEDNVIIENIIKELDMEAENQSTVLKSIDKKIMAICSKFQLKADEIEQTGDNYEDLLKCILMNKCEMSSDSLKDNTLDQLLFKAEITEPTLDGCGKKNELKADELSKQIEERDAVIKFAISATDLKYEDFMGLNTVNQCKVKVLNQILPNLKLDESAPDFEWKYQTVVDTKLNELKKKSSSMKLDELTVEGLAEHRRVKEEESRRLQIEINNNINQFQDNKTAGVSVKYRNQIIKGLSSQDPSLGEYAERLIMDSYDRGENLERTIQDIMHNSVGKGKPYKELDFTKAKIFNDSLDISEVFIFND